MAFTDIRSNASKAHYKKHVTFDDVLVFDEEFNATLRTQQNVSHKNRNKVWLTFVDFTPTYKFDQTKNCMKMSTFEDVMEKANLWFSRHVTPHWSVLSCETLYAKMLVDYCESGNMKVTQISKWPLQDESFQNAFNPNHSIAQQNIHLVSKCTVQLLRVWLQNNKPASGPIERKFGFARPPWIVFKDYWPKMILNKVGNEKTGRNKRNIKVREKMNEVIDRINLDITNQDTFHGPILCVISIPSYSPTSDERKYQPYPKSDRLIHVVRVFYDTSIDAKQVDSIGFADFIPECFSGMMKNQSNQFRGDGCIEYPKFETQSKLVQKVSKWLAQNPGIKFLNLNSVDVNLKANFQIDSSQMSFVRNKGSFVRILRIFYSKPYEMGLKEIQENPGNFCALPPLPPLPPPPIHLNCKNIISLRNSTSELKQQLKDYLAQNCSQVEEDIRCKLLAVESLTIFQPSCNDNKKTADMWDNSFHATILSPSMKSLSVFDGINLFYFGKKSDYDDGEAEGTSSGKSLDIKDNKIENQIYATKRHNFSCMII